MIPKEIISERTANTKIFDKGNGQREMRVYATPVHYKEGKDWKTIDSSIKKISALEELNPLKTFDTFVDARNYQAKWLETKPSDYTFTARDSSISFKALYDTSKVSIKIESSNVGIKETITLDENSPTTLSWQIIKTGTGIVNPPPTAVDANGKEVKVISSQVGDILTYEVDTTDAVFPIEVDPTSVIVTNEAGLNNQAKASWALTRDATSADTVSAQLMMGAWKNESYNQGRVFLSFVIPDMTDISAASLFLYGNGDYTDTDWVMNIVTSTYSDTPVGTDWNNFDGWAASGSYTPTVLNDTWNTSSYSATWNEIVFNAAGLAAILAAKNTTLKLAALSSRDVANTAPTGEERVFFYNSGTAGKEPYLSITYTAPASAPTVTTQAVSSIAKTTATGNGNVTSDGGETVTERGTVYSTSENPTTDDTKDTASGTTGAFTTSIDSLSPGTLYHVRAYAINSVGTSYGADVTFTTKNEVTVQKSLKYTVKTTLSTLTKSLKYAVRTTFDGITKATKYTVITTPLTLEESLAYYVQKEITITEGLIYKIKAPVTVQKSLQYGVISVEQPTKALKYTVKTTPTAVTKSLGYYVMIPATLQLGLQYAVRAPKSSTKGLIYRVTAVDEHSVTKSLRYGVKIENTISLLLGYRVAGIVISKSLKYTVKTEGTITRGLAYEVTNSSAITKQIRYAVRGTNQITKGIVYEVTTPVLMSMKYTVRSPKMLSLACRYTARIYPYSPKASPFSSKASPYTPFPRT